MKKIFTYALALPLMVAMIMSCSREAAGDVAPGEPDGRQWVESDEMFVIKDYRLTADNIVGYSKMLVKGLGVGTRGVVREVEGVVPVLRDEIAAISAVVGSDSVAGGGANGLAARGIVPFSVSESDTVMYAVNFKNDQGYMLLSSDSRVPMLAIIDEGGYNGVGDNPGFHMFLEMSEPYIAYSIAEYERTKDSIAALPSEDIIGNGPSSRIVGPGGGSGDGWGETAGGGYPPMLVPDKYLYDAEFFTTFQVASQPYLVKTIWSQRDPYNDLFDKCPEAGCVEINRRKAAGCVPVAMAQLFAFHRRPAKALGFDKQGFNWTRIVAGDTSKAIKNQTAILLKDIANQLNVKSTCTKTDKENSHSTTADDKELLREILPKYGYTKNGSWGSCTPYKLNNYVLDDVLMSIWNRMPVYISGYADNDGGGHAWLLDGYLIESVKKETWEYWHSYKENRDYRILKNRVVCGPERTYIHCNWGWGHGCNGYFNEGVWDVDITHYDDYFDEVYSKHWGVNHYKNGIGVYTHLRPLR